MTGERRTPTKTMDIRTRQLWSRAEGINLKALH